MLPDRPEAWHESRDNLLTLAGWLRSKHVIETDRELILFLGAPWRYQEEWDLYRHGPARGEQPAEDPFLTEAEAAALLGVGRATLANWRLRGEGPRSFKHRHFIRYLRKDLEAWMQGEES